MINREDIIRMAREAGMRDYCDSWTVEDDPTRKQPKQIHTNDLARFAALVAAAEREACARVCDGKEREKWEQMAKVLTGGLGEIHPIGPKECAAAIRARGKT